MLLRQFEPSATAARAKSTKTFVPAWLQSGSCTDQQTRLVELVGCSELHTELEAAAGCTEVRWLTMARQGRQAY